MRSWLDSLKEEVHLVLHRFNLQLNPGSIFVRYRQWIMFDMTIYDIKSSMKYWGNVQNFSSYFQKLIGRFLAMRIHISSETASALRNWKAFKISLRGQMDMKVWEDIYLFTPNMKCYYREKVKWQRTGLTANWTAFLTMNLWTSLWMLRALRMTTQSSVRDINAFQLCYTLFA